MGTYTVTVYLIDYAGNVSSALSKLSAQTQIGYNYVFFDGSGLRYMALNTQMLWGTNNEISSYPYPHECLDVYKIIDDVRGEMVDRGSRERPDKLSKNTETE